MPRLLSGGLNEMKNFMARQDYFIHLVLDVPDLDEDETLVRVKDLTDEEAKAVEEAIWRQFDHDHDLLSDVRVISETEAQKDPSRYLILSHNARKIMRDLQTSPNRQLLRHVFYRIALAVTDYANELHRLHTSRSASSPISDEYVLLGAGGVKTDGDDEDKSRPAYKRDHRWLEWHEKDGLGPAKIRDKWDRLSDDQRKQICSTASGKIGGTDSKIRKPGGKSLNAR